MSYRRTAAILGLIGVLLIGLGLALLPQGWRLALWIPGSLLVIHAMWLLLRGERARRV